jgi:hypothetical protein
MKVVALVEGVIMKLGMIPGLSFLHQYVTELHGRRTAFDQQVDDYKGYVRSARDAAGDVTQAARGSKKKEDDVDDDVEEEDDDDFESYMQ